MRKTLLTLGLFLWGTLAALGQSVTIPAEVKAPVGRLGSVLVSYDGSDFKYITPPDFDCFREYDPDVRKIRLRFIAYTPGKYQIYAVACKGDKLSDFAVCNVLIGDVPPPIPPGPTPTPPGPGPGPGPGPTPDPAPIPAEGLRVLMIYETADMAKYPAMQREAMVSGRVRDYMNAKCVTGADGKTKEWRLWDQNVDVSNESKIWQDAWKRPRKSTLGVSQAAGGYKVYDKNSGQQIYLYSRYEDAVRHAEAGMPYILISNGRSGYEGTMPANADELLRLLKRFGGE